MKFRLFIALSSVVFLFTIAACNSNENERFNDQEDSYLFESTTSTLMAHGASKLEDDGSMFRCPTVSGMSSESSLTVFKARANAPLPHFTLSSIANVRSDASGGFGISLADFPVGLLDIYQRCNSTSYEKLTTSCPSDYTIVDACGENSDAKECALIYEGTHKLVISSQISSDRACFTEESDRTPYNNAPDVAWACDAFSPVPLAAAYRGDQPSNNCCDEDAQATLDFCLKPCGCRELTVKIVPKNESASQDQDAEQDASSRLSIDDTLKIAVFSNVEGHISSFQRLLESIQSRQVDVAVSLGNLTAEGKSSQYTQMRALIDDAFSVYDGDDDQCTLEDEQICCQNETERLFPNRCNAIIQKTAFIAGIGEDEFEGSGLDTFRELFGSSNSSTTVGKVQLVMLDTAESRLISAQRTWLEGVLETPQKTTCQIPPPTQFERWPSLHACRDILGVPSSSAVTCRECIESDAWCVPPDAERSDPSFGPENCICIPITSTYCQNGFTCEAEDGTNQDCICTRDEDCGTGGTCRDGTCTPPLRLVFSYTPIFDEYGSRNESFVSKSEAASLLSLLIDADVSAVFAGRALDYSHYSKGGIDMYITGGGGAEMSTFAKHGHHWLLVTIPHAYTHPQYEEVSVEVVEFE